MHLSRDDCLVSTAPKLYAYTVMGNPAILPTLPGEQVQPPRLEVRWMVYRLRTQGEKLCRDDVLRTARRGNLKLHRDGDQLTALLVDPSGYPTLDSLHDARVIRMDASGLLLHGSVLSVKGGVVSEIPQAWWCLVERAEPV